MTELKGQWGTAPRTISGVFWEEPPEQRCKMWDWTYVEIDPLQWPPLKMEEAAPSTEMPPLKPAENRQELTSYTLELIYEKYT